MGTSYEYRHIVAFEETNVVGNVYYINHLRWQGRCRELFLREHAPQILPELTSGLSLATVRCSCEYLSELAPFDEVIIRMRLGSISQNRLTLVFDYYLKRNERAEVMVARGEQQIACMRRVGDRLEAEPLPSLLRSALEPFMD